jgi:NTP pyrophosphatase (non-canonical NTP hydrolase)
MPDELKLAVELACKIVLEYGEGAEREHNAAKLGALWSDHPVVQGILAAWNQRPDGSRSRGQPVGGGLDFQQGVDAWMNACFGDAIKADQLERADRFIEEALELAQAMPEFNASRAHALVDYVFSRPIGEPLQEVGGVMVTLAALCNTADIRMDYAAATELARVWTKVDQIRAKQAVKPTGSALPITALARPDTGMVGELDEDWFEEVISDSLEMDWRPRDAARLIMECLALRQPASDPVFTPEEEAELVDQINGSYYLQPNPPASDPEDVERVARAIFRCDFVFDEDEAIVSTREHSLRQARAAIAAMKEQP